MASSAQVQHSAGGVVYRRRGRGAQVVLIATRGPQGLRWGLPKGRLRKTETPAQAAAREVREETGLDVEIESPLPSIEYWFYWKRGGLNVRHRKQVDFFLMSVHGGDVSRHDAEVVEARWVPLARAPAQVSFASERDVLRAVQQHLSHK